MISVAPANRPQSGIHRAESGRCRACPLVLAAVLILASFGAQAEDPPVGTGPGEVTLTIATWGGAYGQSQEIAYFAPYTQKTGVKIKVETYDGSLAAIKDKIGGSASLDVVDLSPAALDPLCRDGL